MPGLEYACRHGSVGHGWDALGPGLSRTWYREAHKDHGKGRIVHTEPPLMLLSLSPRCLKESLDPATQSNYFCRAWHIGCVSASRQLSRVWATKAIEQYNSQHPVSQR